MLMDRREAVINPALEPIRCQLCIPHRVLDFLVTMSPSCRGPVRNRETASVPKHMWHMNDRLAMPARSMIRAKPAVVNGAPRSDVNTNGDFVKIFSTRRG
jgi:hypothetical protein